MRRRYAQQAPRLASTTAETTTVTGTDNGNPYRYTGREDDGTGLYFYRERYYSPVLQRFLSEDPIGFAGGINLYAYVNNQPTLLTDPTGEKPANPGGGRTSRRPHPRRHRLRRLRRHHRRLHRRPTRPPCRSPSRWCGRWG